MRVSHKPNSVPAPPCGHAGGNHLSRTPVTRRLKQPTRGLQASNLLVCCQAAYYSPARSCSRWGLLGQPVTRLPVGSYLTISPLPGSRLLVVPPYMKLPGGMFLWHFPWGHPHWPLASILLCGVRTFLGRCRPRLPVLLAPTMLD